ncbi:M1 family metallopeptidase [Nocardioides sp.]|uniref:M1 family metallopeptidase n=1 Tax=Nocardioides sp. TaxID=35761 RepID=UPI002627E968|nr:M1 family metallopeptidase [Nocardioides sp.]
MTTVKRRPSALSAACLTLGLLAGAAGLAGCGASTSGSTPTSSPSASTSSSGSTETAYDAAVSTPQTDSVYPLVGDKVVDALHYGLDLTWDKTRLSGTETLTFRAAVTSPTLTLDFGAALTATKVTLDGTEVTSTHTGQDLVVAAPVTADSRHVLTLTYAGTPTPVKDPAKRSDAEPLGLTATPEGGLWTMQEPYGAFTWYAVNDQPADKALYDVTVHAPAGMVGISNGTLTSRTDTAAGTTTVWHSAAPMASYLTTLAVGAYTETKATSASGVPLAYWVPTDDSTPLKTLKKTPELLAWLEKRLGPYPFDSLSILIVPAQSAMETQTTLTLGNTPDSYSADVLVHEMAHQWYGDEVTPADWRDVWMNEGMATYLQMTWQDQAWGRNAGDSLADMTLFEADDRANGGPPGAYKADHFADDNVYSSTALMWDQVRKTVGKKTFWKLVREWPAARAGTSVTRADYLSWLSTTSGTNLRPLITRWLMSRTTPPLVSSSTHR